MRIKQIDWIIFATTFLLVFWGIVLIYSITYTQEATKNLALHQLIFSFVGMTAMFLFSFLDYRVFKVIAGPFYLLLLSLLVFLILSPYGKTALGATRWLDFGFFQFQPSELFKIAYIAMLAKVSSADELFLKNFLSSIFLLVLPIVLVMFQPDLGTAIILLLIGLTIILFAGYQKRYLAILGGMVLIFLLVFVLSAFSSTPPFSGLLKEYQKERILTFLNPKRDPFGSGYNVSQSVIAIGSGGLFGRGLGYGSQSQLNFIPSKQNDFIFAVAGESFGFLGVFILLSLYFVLLLRILRIAQLARDNFGALFAYGTLTYFLFSVFINIGMTLGLLPAVGIPLPLMSYGGTSLITSLAAIGICQSIFIHHKKISFGT